MNISRIVSGRPTTAAPASLSHYERALQTVILLEGLESWRRSSDERRARESPGIHAGLYELLRAPGPRADEGAYNNPADEDAGDPVEGLRRRGAGRVRRGRARAASARGSRAPSRGPRSGSSSSCRRSRSRARRSRPRTWRSRAAARSEARGCAADRAGSRRTPPCSARPPASLRRRATCARPAASRARAGESGRRARALSSHRAARGGAAAFCASMR